MRVYALLSAIPFERLETKTSTELVGMAGSARRQKGQEVEVQADQVL